MTLNGYGLQRQRSSVSEAVADLFRAAAGTQLVDCGAPSRDVCLIVLDGAYRLRQSQCFLKSAEKLRCTTCHDPHNIPRGAVATAHYNRVCETCHAAIVQPGAASGPHRAGANCIECHIPKRRTDDVAHAVMTDHFIQRRKPAGGRSVIFQKPVIHAQRGFECYFWRANL